MTFTTIEGLYLMASFDMEVWGLLEQIPKRKITTYGEIAKKMQNPMAARAVGNACNKNPNAPKVPCHRVVSSNGYIGGYAFGSDKKIQILAEEGIQVKNGKVIDFEAKLFSYN